MIESMINTTSKYLTLSLQDLQQNDIEILRSLIQYHRKQYYELEKPLITDDEFDRLYSLLVAGEEKFGMEHEYGSPTQEVNRLAENHFTKAPHRHAMMSLDNTYNADDLLEFEKRIKRILYGNADASNRIEYIVEYKFDGLGIALTYE